MSILQNKWTPLFLSNFLSVFNDNLLKNCIIFVAVGWSLPHWLTQSQLISLVSASLIVPYLFLSPLAGRLAIIYSKKRVFSLFKLIEIPVLMLACYAFYFQLAIVAVLSVLLMGILSCLYSPAKYSLIYDIGGKEQASFGSGIFEMMAFLGILIGTVTASIVSDNYSNWLVFSLYIGLGVLGYWVTTLIATKELPENKSEQSHLNPFRFLLESFRYAKHHELVNSAVFGASSFWLIGGMLQMNLVIHCKQVFHASNSITGLAMSCAAIGIALGCWIAGKISRNGVQKGLILIGIAGMSVLFFVITFIQLNIVLFVIGVFLVAVMGGIFQIPCLSMIQNANLGRKLADMIGYLNLVTFILVLLGTLLFSITTYFTAENSYSVFAVIFGACVFILLYFIFISPVFWQDTKALLKRKS